MSQVSAGYFHSCGIKTNGVLVCWGSNEYGQLPLVPGAEGLVPPGKDRELVIEAPEYHAVISVPAQTVSDYTGLTYSSLSPNHFMLVGTDSQQQPVSELDGLVTVRVELQSTLQTSQAAESLRLFARTAGGWVPVEELCDRPACSQQGDSTSAQMSIEYLGEFFLGTAPPAASPTPTDVGPTISTDRRRHGGSNAGCLCNTSRPGARAHLRAAG